METATLPIPAIQHPEHLNRYYFGTSKPPKIFVLIGKFATGKSSMAKDITECTRIPQVITATSRPKRDNEVHGIDYYFTPFEKINPVNYAAIEVYNSWKYGVPKTELETDECRVVVLTPSGYRELKETYGSRVVGIYLMSRTIDRVERYMARDSVNKENITEMVRRLHTDDVDFHEFEFEVEHVVLNKGTYQQTLDRVLSVIAAESFGI